MELAGLAEFVWGLMRTFLQQQMTGEISCA